MLTFARDWSAALATGTFLAPELKAAGYTFEEAREAGFKRKLADWMSMDLTNPYNKWW